MSRSIPNFCYEFEKVFSLPSGTSPVGIWEKNLDRNMCETTPPEEKRLEAVRSLNLLDRPEEERFQRITRLVRRHFRAARCAITLVDEHRAYSLAQDGEVRSVERSRADSLCASVVSGKVPLVVSESSDADIGTYAELVERLNLKFYAGVPILNPDGFAVGALCVVDHAPRRFSRRDLESLADFAAIVEDEIMLRRADSSQRELISQVERLRIKAFVDPLTGVWNRGAIFEILLRESERSRRVGHPLGLCMFDLDHFKRVNDTYGHQVGDLVLQETCRRARNCIRPYDALGRYGGEEFLVVFPDSGYDQSLRQAERLRRAVGEEPFDLGKSQKGHITVSVGVALYSPQEELNGLVARVDQALYKAKHQGRNIVVGSEYETAS